MLLICNNRPAAIEVVGAFAGYDDPAARLRLLRMHGRGHSGRDRLREDPSWQEGIRQVALLEGLETLDLALADPTEPGSAR